MHRNSIKWFFALALLLILPTALPAQTNRASRLLTITNPLPYDYDHFGSAVVPVGNDMVLIGMNAFNHSGRTYLFSTNGTLQTVFTNPNTGGDAGNAVAAVGNDRLLIGAFRAGSAFLFSTNGSLLATLRSPEPSGASVYTDVFGWISGDGFGWAVSALGNDRLLVGAVFDYTGAKYAGVVHLFDTNGTLLNTFTNPNPMPSNYFGHSITSLGNDRILVGAPSFDTGSTNRRAAYLLDTNGAVLATFTSTNTNDVAFGFSLATLNDSQVLISAQPRAYLFSTNGDLVTTFTNLNSLEGLPFGGSIAPVGTDRVLVRSWGYSTSGRTWIFSTNGQPLTSLTNISQYHDGDMGRSIAALNDGQIVVGLPRSGVYEAGNALIYQLPANYEAAIGSISLSTGSATVNQGTDVSFSVLAIGTPPFFYQWSYKTNPIPGQMNSVLSLTNVQPSSAGSYFVTVSNLYGAATSSVVSLFVNIPPTITSHPQSITNTVGDLTVFTVVATSSSLRYQWFFGSNALLDATNSTLTLTNVARANSGYYSVTITNVLGSITSSNALLVVRASQRILPLMSLDGDRYQISFADFDGGLLFPWDLDNLEVQGSTNMSSANWVTLTNALVITNGVGQVEFVVTNSPPQQFYRIRMR